jgi:sorbose reductase
MHFKVDYLPDNSFVTIGAAYQVNITNQEEVEKTVDQVVTDFNGRLDVFVANSGIAWSEGPALDSSVSHYREVLSTNLDGVYYSALAAGKHWRRQAKERTTIHGKELEHFTLGSFIATASMSGHIVNVPHIQAAYNVSKAGVIHLCKSSEENDPNARSFVDYFYPNR